MRIHLPRLGVIDGVDGAVDVFERVAAVDRFGVHELVEEPEDADAVLFVQCHLVDWRLRAIRESAVFSAHWRKAMVYDERDRPWLSLPGVYVGAPGASFDVGRQRAWSYVRVEPVPMPLGIEPDLLFSFVGSPTAECRRRLMQLHHPDAVLEEVQGFMYWMPDDSASLAIRRRYAEIFGRSRFVLCPRGRGTSTLRLYETLAAGRVPVIISDEWVPPPGPDWSRCSLRVSEKEVASIPSLLAERDAEWGEMSRVSKEIHRDFFRDDVAFHRIVELLSELAGAPSGRSGRTALRWRAGAASVREHLRTPAG